LVKIYIKGILYYNEYLNPFFMKVGKCVMKIYHYDVMKANGDIVSLSEYKEKVLLIVNTASKCGFTPQFEDLQKLYEQYQDQGLEILAFPCNQFNGQEPGTSEEAGEFCKINYGVTFPVFNKIDVNGTKAHPLFRFLKNAAPFQGFDEQNINEKFLKMMLSEKYPEWLSGDEIKWNFTKFLIDANGTVFKRYESPTEPLQLKDEIEKLLQK